MDNKLKEKGVYKLSIDKHTYIGSTKRDVWTRFKEHRYLLSHNKHYNKKMQSWYNQYHTLNVSLLEQCNNVQDICTREQYYINKYKPDINIIYNVATY